MTSAGHVLSVDDKSAVDRGFMSLRSVWALMFVSLGIYVGVCHVLEGDIHGIADIEDAYPVLKDSLLVISFFQLFAIHYAKRAILRGKGEGRKTAGEGATQQAGKAALQRYMSALVVSLALAESVGVYGLVLFIFGGSFGTMYVFAGLSAIAMLAHIPRKGEVEALALSLKSRG